METTHSQTVEVVYEPVEMWRNLAGHNLLGNFYEDTQKNGFTLQVCIKSSHTNARRFYTPFFRKSRQLLFVHTSYSHIFNSPVSSPHFRSTPAQLASWRGRSTPPSTASPKISTAQRYRCFKLYAILYTIH